MDVLLQQRAVLKAHLISGALDVQDLVAADFFKKALAAAGDDFSICGDGWCDLRPGRFWLWSFCRIEASTRKCKR
jgi:hypothetical protein